MRWVQMDQWHWQSDLGYRVCVSRAPRQQPVWLAWAPRTADAPRSPGALLGAGVADRQEAYALCEAHRVEQGRAEAC